LGWGFQERVPLKQEQFLEYFFCLVLAALEFELRTSLAKLAFYHLSYSTRPEKTLRRKEYT
jgi:hypothetical protein